MACLSAVIPPTSPAGGWESAEKSDVDAVVGSCGDLDPDQGAFECNKGSIVINIIAPSCDALLRPLFGSRRPVQINLVRPFRGLSKNPHLIGLNLDETPRDGKEQPAITHPVA